MEEFTLKPPEDIYLTILLNVIVVTEDTLPVKMQFLRQQPFNNEIVNVESVLYNYMNELKQIEQRDTFMHNKKLSLREKNIIKSVMECLISLVFTLI